MNQVTEGTARIVLDETDSTNAEAMRRALAGAALPFWLLAHRQSAGRGRRGRGWVSGVGNFHGSLAMKVEGGPAQAALRSLVAALALVDALEAAGLEPGRISLKWPNDVLLDGGKLAGILLESSASGDVVTLVTGIGVNLAHAPEAVELEASAVPAVSLAGAGIEVAPEAFLDLLAPVFAAREAALVSGGFAPIRADWLARAARLGEVVTARLPGEAISGVFETMDESGALVLQTGTGRRVIHAADVQFG